MLFLTPLFFVLSASSRKGPRGPIASVFATTVDQSDIRVLGPHELDSPGASSLYVRASVTSMRPAQGWAEDSPYRTANATGPLGSLHTYNDSILCNSDSVRLVLVPSRTIAPLILMPIDILAHAVIKSTHQEFLLPGNCPYEPRQLTRHRRHRLGVVLPTADQPLHPVMQPLLRLPRDGADLGRHPYASVSEGLAHPRLTPIMPRRLDQHVTEVGVARLRDRTPTAMGTRGLFRGNQSDVAHEVTRCLEPSVVSHLRRQRHGRHELDSPHRLQCLDQWRQMPTLNQMPQPLCQLLHSKRGSLDGCETVGQDVLLGRFDEGLLGDPSLMRAVPGGPTWVTFAVAEQEFAELMPDHPLGLLVPARARSRSRIASVGSSGMKTGTSSPAR